MQARQALCRSTTSSMFAPATRSVMATTLPTSSFLISTRYYVATTGGSSPSSSNEGIKNYKNDINDRAQELGNQARRGFEASRDKFKDNYERAKETVQASTSQAKEGFEKVKEGWNEKDQSMGGWNKPKEDVGQWSKTGQNADDKAKELGNKARDAWDSNVDKAKSAAEQAKDTIGDKAKDLGNKATKMASDMGEAISDKAKDAMNATTQTASKMASDLGTKASQTASGISEAVSDKAKDMADKAKSAVDSMNDKQSANLTDAAKNTAANLWEKAKDVAGDAAQSTKAAASEIRNEAADLGEKMREGFGKTEDKGYSAWQSASSSTNATKAGMSPLMTACMVAAAGALGYYAYTTYLAVPAARDTPMRVKTAANPEPPKKTI